MPRNMLADGMERLGLDPGRSHTMAIEEELGAERLISTTTNTRTKMYDMQARTIPLSSSNFLHRRHVRLPLYFIDK